MSRLEEDVHGWMCTCYAYCGQYCLQTNRHTLSVEEYMYTYMSATLLKVFAIDRVRDRVRGEPSSAGNACRMIRSASAKHCSASAKFLVFLCRAGHRGREKKFKREEQREEERGRE